MKKPVLVAALVVASAACARESATPGPAQSLPSASGAPATQPAESRKPQAPIAIYVLAETKSASPSALALEWVKQLEAALIATPAQFKLVKSEPDAEVVVRIADVTPSPESPGKAVMTGSLARGGKPSAFRVDYTGGASAMAGRFAKYVAAQVEKARSAAPEPAQQP